MPARTGLPEPRLRVVLRAAAGAAVGYGHLMRAVAVAEGLRDSGARPVLLADGRVSDAQLDAVRRGVAVERIDAGTNLADDAAATAAAARRLAAAVIVTDVCTQPALANLPELDAYHRRLKDAVDSLVVFSAGRHLDPSAALVVNPYLLGGGGSSAGDERVLWGPQYFIFRSEFIRASTTARTIAAVVKRVVVAVGGSDPAGLTPRIIDALAAEAPAVSVRAVAGPGLSAAECDLLTERVPRLGWELVPQPDDMAALFLWADLAITGDGLTKYETAVTGTPSVIVARPDSDPRINAEFAAAGTTVCVEPGENLRWDGLRPAIARLLNDTSARDELSRRGRQLTDGRGLERVLARIRGLGAASRSVGA